jgi:hypothetical protein
LFCKWFWEGADGRGCWTWWHDYQLLMLLWIGMLFLCFWQVGWQEILKVLTKSWVNKMGCKRWTRAECIGEYLFCFQKFFLLCRCTSPYVVFEMQCSRCSLTRKNIVSFVPL